MGGRSKCWINGHLATVNQLSLLGAHLVDIVGQHDSQRLLRPENHVELLDSYGGTSHLSILEEADKLASSWLALALSRNGCKATSGKGTAAWICWPTRSKRLRAPISSQAKMRSWNRSARAWPTWTAFVRLCSTQWACLGENQADGQPLLDMLSSIETELERASALDPPLEP